MYLGMPSSLWNFDGVACAAALEFGDPTYFFHSQHLLYGWLGWLFWIPGTWILPSLRALTALQVLTPLMSAAAAVGLARLLTPIVQDRWSALMLTLLLAFTPAFWIWSIEPQVYALGTLGLSWATVWLRNGTEERRWIGVGVFHGLSMLGHLLHGLWCIPALYILHAEGGGRRRWGYYGVSLALTVGLPYALVIIGVLVPSGKGLEWILIWLKGSAGLTPSREFAWHWHGWDAPWVWAQTTAQAWFGVIQPYAPERFPEWAWVAAAAAATVLLSLLWRCRRDVTGTLWRRFSILWIAVYGLFLWTWEPATLCYRMPEVIPFGILLALGLRTFPVERARWLAAAGATAMAFTTGISHTFPMQNPLNNAVYQDVLKLSRSTPAESLYLATDSKTQLYLLYFTGRRAWLNRRALPAGSPVYQQTPEGWTRIG